MLKKHRQTNMRTENLTQTCLYARYHPHRHAQERVSTRFATFTTNTQPHMSTGLADTIDIHFADIISHKSRICNSALVIPPLNTMHTLLHRTPTSSHTYNAPQRYHTQSLQCNGRNSGATHTKAQNRLRGPHAHACLTWIHWKGRQ